jgi:NAD-dependent DNA ligase
MSKRKAGEALAGMVFAITGTVFIEMIRVTHHQLTHVCEGTLTIPRAQFEALIEANGGTNVKTVTNSCTHLIR